MKKVALNFSFLFSLLILIPAYGQNEASKALDDLIGMPLKGAHEKLLDMGFEIAQSSLFNEKQLWYNESKNECVSFSFDKNGDMPIEAIKPGKEKKCVRGVRASRRVWANYRDGGADASSAAIDKERETLRQQGYQVSYWVNDVSPGKTMEVWYNESAQLSKSISWDNATKSNIKILDRDPRLGKNPAPVYNNKNM